MPVHVLVAGKVNMTSGEGDFEDYSGSTYENEELNEPQQYKSNARKVGISMRLMGKEWY